MQKTMRKKNVQNHVMQKPCKNHVKIMSKSCHANMQKPCKHAKTMQKPCKNHATCGAYAGVYTAKKRASCSCHAKNKLFHMSCKNHATCGAYAGVYAGRRGTAAWRVRYSTYSTYSKDAGESGGSAAWLQCRAGAPRGFCARQVARNFVAILRQQESAMEQF